MRVMHILNTSSFSGAENVVVTIINSTKNNVESCYVSFNGDIKNTLDKNNIQYLPVKNMSIFEIRRVVKVFNPDIIHAHDYTTSVISALACLNIPIISHLHNNPPWIKRFCSYSILYLFASLRLKKILGVSQSIFNEYIFGKLINKKVKVISNPIDITLINEKSLYLDNTTKIYDIIFLGRLTAQKNPLKFIEIIESILQVRGNIKVAMIGSGKLERECRRILLRQKLTNVIDMLGFVENPLPILKKSKMLILPSLWEGFGMVAIEALSLGIPVIASPVGGLADIVTEDCGKLCRNDEEFVNEISKLLYDDKYQKTKSKNALERAEKLNNIEVYIDSLLEIYRAVI